MDVINIKDIFERFKNYTCEGQLSFYEFQLLRDPETCNTTDCWYNDSGVCKNVDDLHSPSQNKDCVSFIEDDE